LLWRKANVKFICGQLLASSFQFGAVDEGSRKRGGDVRCLQRAQRFRLIGKLKIENAHRRIKGQLRSPGGTDPRLV